MKPKLLLFLFGMLLFCATGVNTFAQPTVTVEVDGNNLYYSEPSCGDCNGSPDPRWRVQANFNGTVYNWDEDRDNIGACGWKGYTNVGWTPVVGGVPAGNNISINLHGWEDDGFVCGGADYDCGGYANVNTVPITAITNPPCNWNQFTGSRICGGSGDYRVQWSYYWYYSGGFVPGTVTGDQTICVGGDPAAFTNSASGSTGNFITYQWQSSPNNSVWTDIPGATGPTYDPGVLTVTTYYRRLVKAVQTCNAYQVNSNTITVTVIPLPTVTASGSTTICAGTTTVLSAVGSGGFGAGSYQWESSPNNFLWSSIPGANSPTYTTSLLAGSLYYRCVYTTTASGCQTTSNTVTVTVNNASSTPTSITGTNAICIGSSTTLSVSGGSLGTGANWEWFSGACGGVPVGTGSSVTVSPSVNTNYFVRASASGPCPATACASVTVSTSTPTVAGSATPNAAVFCQGGSTTVTLAGQTGNVVNWEQQINGGGWSDIGSSGVIVLNTGALNSPGTNQFRAVVQSGVCPALASNPANIQVDPTSVGGTVGASQTSLCPGGTVTLTLSGHTGSIVQWERQANGGGWTNLGNTGVNPLTTSPFAGPGVFEYRALVQSGTCAPTYSDVVTVTVNAFDDASFSYAQSAFCQGGMNPSPSITLAGGTFTATPAGLGLSASTGIIDLGNSLPGSYTITHTTSGSCPSTATRAVTIVASPSSDFNYSALSYCLNAGTNPVPTVTNPGGTFRSQNPGLIFADINTGEIDLTLSQPGSYFVEYSLAGACPSASVQTVILTAPGNSAFSYAVSTHCLGAPNPSPSVAQLGGTFTATPLGLVFANASTGTIDLTASTAGTYVVTYTSAGPCPGSSTQSITLNPAGDPMFFYSTASFCKNASNPVPFVSSPGGGFTASPAGLLFVSPSTGEINLAASQPGNYLITYSTGGPCPATYSQNVLIIQNQNATFNYAQTAYCQNGTNPTPSVAQIGGVFTASPAGLVFANNLTGQINLASSATGTYTVTYTVPGSCVGTYTQTVTVNAAASASLSYPSATYCSNGTNPLATSAAPGGTFSATPAGLVFADASGTINLAGTVPGAYTVAYTTAGTCAATATTNVSVVEAPQAFIQPISTLCTGSPTVILTASPSGGTWSGGAYINASGQFDPAVSGAGSFPVTYTVASPGGCNANATYNVLVNASPAVNVTAAGPFCSNDSIQVLTATPAGGTWSGNPFVSVNGLFFPGESGAGVFPVIYTLNSGACRTDAQISVQVVNAAVASINPVAPLCANSAPIGLSATVAGGTWSGGAYVSPTGTFDPALAAVGNNSVTYTVTNGGCTTTVTAQIPVSGTPNVSILTPTPFCRNDTPDFIVTNIPGGVFAGGAFINGSGLFNPALATVGNNTVIYTFTGNNGCVGSDTATVLVNANPDATITYPGIICEGATPFTLTAATPGGTWSGGAYVNAGIFDPTVAGFGQHVVNYSVTSGTCSSTASITVTVAPKPIAMFNFHPNGLGATFTDLSANGDSWSWNFGDGSAEVTTQHPAHLFPDNGTYVVRLIVFNDCGSDTLLQNVMVNKAVGIAENGDIASLNLFPNPTDGFISLTADQLKAGEWQMGIFDISGKEMWKEAVYPSGGTLQKTIDVTTLNPGIYFIQLKNKETVHTVKFVKM